MPNRPWLRTEGHVPYVAIQGTIAPPVDRARVFEALDTTYDFVENVYNRRAYSLDSECKYVFCMDDDQTVAILLTGDSFRNGDFPWDNFRSLSMEIDEHLQEINKLISHLESQPSLSLFTLKMEVSDAL